MKYSEKCKSTKIDGDFFAFQSYFKNLNFNWKTKVQLTNCWSHVQSKCCNSIGSQNSIANGATEYVFKSIFQNFKLSSSHQWKITLRMCAMCSQPCWERRKFSLSRVQLCMLVASFLHTFQIVFVSLQDIRIDLRLYFAHFPILALQRVSPRLCKVKHKIYFMMMKH